MSHFLFCCRSRNDRKRVREDDADNVDDAWAEVDEEKEEEEEDMPLVLTRAEKDALERRLLSLPTVFKCDCIKFLKDGSSGLQNLAKLSGANQLRVIRLARTDRLNLAQALERSIRPVASKTTSFAGVSTPTTVATATAATPSTTAAVVPPPTMMEEQMLFAAPPSPTMEGLFRTLPTPPPGDIPILSPLPQEPLPFQPLMAHPPPPMPPLFQPLMAHPPPPMPPPSQLLRTPPVLGAYRYA